jgi:hypothetical protein
MSSKNVKQEMFILTDFPLLVAHDDFAPGSAVTV